MKKIYTLLLLAASLSLYAQLPNGSFAPNWTATDIDGNEWNLYEVLESGRSVVLEVTATWSGQSWEYHESGVLSDFYNLYGPDGSNEAMVFFIEADNGTTLDDLNGTGNDTQGNWLENIPYPIIDDAEFIANLYEAYGYPSHVLICPNRLLSSFGFPTDFAIYQLSQECLVPSGQNNAGIYTYVGFEGELCGEETFAPSVVWQNLGVENITAAELGLYLNGALTETISWTGDLPPLAIDPQGFTAVTVSEATTLEVVISSVNSMDDDDPSNNVLQVEIIDAPATAENFLSLEITTDDYPLETYWEIMDASGTVFHRGGNPGVFDNVVLPGAYAQASATYTHEVPLPIDGCYELVVYDAYGDGICCDYGLGNYRLREPNNAILLQGGLFTDEDRRPFALSGAVTIANDATLTGYDGPRGDFCGELDFSPFVELKNLGANDLTSVDFEITDGMSILQNFTWNGNLAPGQMEAVELDGLSLDSSTDLIINILNANNQPDTIPSGNTIEVELVRRLTTTPALTLDIQTDNWGYEIYWEIRTLTGKVIAYGGNETVGPDGGGLRVAGATDPGAYPDNENITEEILLSDGFDDCYEFLFVDDWGDGLGGSGFLKLTDETGNLLFNAFPLGSYDSHLIDAQLGVSSVTEIGALEGLEVFPNPTSHELQVSFSLSQNTELQVGIFNTFGQRISRLADGHFAAGSHSLTANVAGLPAGIYFLRMSGKEELSVRRFTVAEK